MFTRTAELLQEAAGCRRVALTWIKGLPPHCDKHGCSSTGEWRCKVSDFCLSRPMLDRVFRQAELMDRVMAHVGVNPAVAARVDKGVAFYEARTKCISCCHERECRNWLQSATTQSRPAPFCPNAAFLRSCAKRSR
ncbi:MAG: hypothetical protein K2X43_18410 [Hyphomonadaceae bacterium]|jgi:hypothetical protein|nr:hypothetical protein [Hyphomonadaceae bacterium]